MKKIFLSLFVFLFLNSCQMSYAQLYSVAQTKEILQNNLWKLRRYEENGRKFSLLNVDRGLLLVFKKNGDMYMQQPALPDKAIEPRPFTVTKTHIIYGNNVEDPRFRYELEEDLVYTLRLTNEDVSDPVTYVWEADDLFDGTYPKVPAVVIGANRDTYESTPYEAESIIRSIDAKVKEAIGNIRIFAKSKEKYVVEDASFSATEFGVKLMVKLSKAGQPLTEFNYEFMPEEINTMSQINMTNESPVGQLKIKLNSKSANVIVTQKKQVIKDKYDDQVNLNFVKVDAANYKKIEGYLHKLRNIYDDKRTERLQLMRDLMMMTGYDDLWVSGKGSSSTYILQEVYPTGRTLRVQYSLKTISTSGDKTGTYITEIPLRDIKEISLDKSKSRPNTIILHAGKAGFKTYKRQKDSIYELDKAVDEIPLFIDVTQPARLERTLELLKTHVKECGGKKLSL